MKKYTHLYVNAHFLIPNNGSVYYDIFASKIPFISNTQINKLESVNEEYEKLFEEENLSTDNDIFDVNHSDFSNFNNLYNFLDSWYLLSSVIKNQQLFFAETIEELDLSIYDLFISKDDLSFLVETVNFEDINEDYDSFLSFNNSQFQEIDLID